jgi:60 kDa SS-A/Ro ribonucleoprotein
MLNVGSAKNGIGYGPKWVNIGGMSENVLRFIQELERSGN